MSHKANKKRIDLKGRTDLAKAIEYLENIVASLKSGTLCVQNGSDETLTLKPEQAIDLEVNASQRADKESVSLKLSWRKTAAECETLPLKITSREPEPAAANE
jgi:amphi-Trp domain-containing protein